MLDLFEKLNDRPSPFYLKYAIFYSKWIEAATTLDRKERESKLAIFRSDYSSLLTTLSTSESKEFVVNAAFPPLLNFLDSLNDTLDSYAFIKIFLIFENILSIYPFSLCDTVPKNILDRVSGIFDKFIERGAELITNDKTPFPEAWYYFSNHLKSYFHYFLLFTTFKRNSSEYSVTEYTKYYTKTINLFTIFIHFSLMMADIELLEEINQAMSRFYENVKKCASYSPNRGFDIVFESNKKLPDLHNPELEKQIRMEIRQLLGKIDLLNEMLENSKHRFERIQYDMTSEMASVSTDEEFQIAIKKYINIAYFITEKKITNNEYRQFLNLQGVVQTLIDKHKNSGHLRLLSLCLSKVFKTLNDNIQKKLIKIREVQIAPIDAKSIDLSDDTLKMNDFLINDKIFGHFYSDWLNAAGNISSNRKKIIEEFESKCNVTLRQDLSIIDSKLIHYTYLKIKHHENNPTRYSLLECIGLLDNLFNRTENKKHLLDEMGSFILKNQTVFNSFVEALANYQIEWEVIFPNINLYVRAILRYIDYEIKILSRASDIKKSSNLTLTREDLVDLSAQLIRQNFKIRKVFSIIFPDEIREGTEAIVFKLLFFSKNLSNYSLIEKSDFEAIAILFNQESLQEELTQVCFFSDWISSVVNFDTAAFKENYQDEQNQSRFEQIILSPVLFLQEIGIKLSHLSFSRNQESLQQWLACLSHACKFVINKITAYNELSIFLEDTELYFNEIASLLNQKFDWKLFNKNHVTYIDGIYQYLNLKFSVIEWFFSNPSGVSDSKDNGSFFRKNPQDAFEKTVVQFHTLHTLLLKRHPKNTVLRNLGDQFTQKSLKLLNTLFQNKAISDEMYKKIQSILMPSQSTVITNAKLKELASSQSRRQRKQNIINSTPIPRNKGENLTANLIALSEEETCTKQVSNIQRTTAKKNKKKKSRPSWKSNCKKREVTPCEEVKLPEPTAYQPSESNLIEKYLSFQKEQNEKFITARTNAEKLKLNKPKVEISNEVKAEVSNIETDLKKMDLNSSGSVNNFILSESFTINDTIADVVINLFKSQGVTIFLKGGCVRDSILISLKKIGFKKSRDYDFLVFCSKEQFERVSKEIFKIDITQNMKIKDATVYACGSFDFVLLAPPFSLNQLKLDAQKCDYLLNAFYYDGKDFYDPLGSIEKIKSNNIIESVGNANDSYRINRVRIIRGVTLAISTRFNLSDDILKSIHEAKYPLHEIAFGILRHHLCKLFLYSNGKISMEMINNLGLYAQLFKAGKPNFKHYWNQNDRLQNFIIERMSMLDDYTLVLNGNELIGLLMFPWILHNYIPGEDITDTIDRCLKLYSSEELSDTDRDTIAGAIIMFYDQLFPSSVSFVESHSSYTPSFHSTSATSTHAMSNEIIPNKLTDYTGGQKHVAPY